MKPLGYYANRWAMLNALARSEKTKIPVVLHDQAYRAYVDGRTGDLKEAVALAAGSLKILASEIHKRWKQLPKSARRETSRRAFQR